MHYMYIHICIHLYIRCSTILCFSVEVPSCSFACMYVAAHSLMKRKQVDREELERRDQLKQLRSEAEQMVCSFTGEHFNWSS